MNVFAGLALTGLAILALLVGRSALFPPVVYAGVWAGALFLLAMAGETLYPISDATRLMYLLGAGAFVAGGFAARALTGRLPGPAAGADAPASPRMARFADAAIVIMAVALPFYWQELQQTLRASAATTLLHAARLRDLQAQAGLTPPMPLALRSLVQLSIIFALITFSVASRTTAWRLRAAAAFGLCLIYQVLTGGRAGVALLVFGVIGIVWVRAGRVRLVRVLPVVVVFLLLFELVAIQLEKGFVRRGLSLRENLPALVTDFRAYLLGGVVGFDRIVQYPGEIPSTGGLTRTMKEMANRLGAHYDLPGLHADYTTLADFVEGNVYTAYFQYLPDYGVVGMLFFPGLLGVACTVVYAWARRGSPAGRVFYGILFVGILQSVFIEGFYTNVNLLAKTAVLLLVLHVWWRRPAGQAEAPA